MGDDLFWYIHQAQNFKLADDQVTKQNMNEEAKESLTPLVFEPFLNREPFLMEPLASHSSS